MGQRAIRETGQRHTLAMFRWREELTRRLSDTKEMIAECLAEAENSTGEVKRIGPIGQNRNSEPAESYLQGGGCITRGGVLHITTLKIQHLGLISCGSTP
jgi:hypothetical protein